MWGIIIKTVEKQWDHLKFIEEMTKTMRRAQREMKSIENTIVDFPSKVKVIVGFLNQISKEEVININLNKFEWVTRAN